ncbi:Asp-tRNA(Asn)/Glu-tRNA(Gln) amidotransferase subunit GatB [Bradyrhizobium sp. AUGA SZCCT0182]|nr:Asp-tRNA(Asn)/Glu-tRNA(Gln) amidotransferase subunit GatB [Bradyrhizobium sp. AUGA SZCCT0182]
MNATVKPAKLIRGVTGDWEMVIGLEVHAQVTSQSKLFSGASTEFGGEPNTHVSLVDAAMPGMLPVINEECVRQAVRTGLGLNAQINLRSVFDRKNYFYPDSPQGYQISQYKSPIVGEGVVEVELDGGHSVSIGIERLHLEQDAGKSLHDQSPTMSYVDLNRCGVALMEIVSKPDIRDAEQAKAYVTKLRSILRYLGTCDGDMEKGSLRADVNVSVRKPGGPLGTRCEIKNMNSINFIGQAIEYEARRQIEIIEDGGVIDQETRLYDPGKGETRSMRSKEEAHDYRYFPDPDLLPLEFSEAYVAGLKAELPELPDQKKARFIEGFGLSPYDASVLVAERERAEYFEAMVGEGAEPKSAANWLINEYLGRMSRQKSDLPIMDWVQPLSQPVQRPARPQPGFFTPVLGPLPPSANTAIVTMISTGVISGKTAKDVLEAVFANPKIDPRAYVSENNLTQVTDLGAIEKVVDDIVAANPDKVAQAKAKPAAVQWFVGQVMKSSGGKADPKAVNVLLRSKLGLEGGETPNMPVKKNRDVLFEDRKRTRQEPLQRGERLFDYYDECARSGYDEFRLLMNGWLSDVALDDRRQLISRMRNGGNNAFGAALCELVVHALLIALNYKVVAHPSLPGTDAHPDFAATDQSGKRLYVEVTTVNRADEKVDQLGREAPIYNAINQAKLPAGCLLGYTLVQAGPDKPDLSTLLDSVELWAKESSASGTSTPIVRRFVIGEWIVELELFSGGSSAAGSPAIGVAWGGGGVITPHQDIRGGLWAKTNKYGSLDAPYLIVVADAKDQIFGPSQAKNAIAEALFGTELVVSVDGKISHDRARDGLWFGPEGARNQHVSGILLIPQTDIWKLREANREPILALNPWATSPLPEAVRGLPRLEAMDHKLVEYGGKSLADILGVPIPWPPSE